MSPLSIILVLLSIAVWSLLVKPLKDVMAGIPSFIFGVLAVLLMLVGVGLLIEPALMAWMH